MKSSLQVLAAICGAPVVAGAIVSASQPVQPLGRATGLGPRSGGPDRLLLRDGSTRIGALTGCGGEACLFGGTPIERARIEWIGLAGAAGAPPAVTGGAAAVFMTSGEVRAESLESVNAHQVITDAGGYPRSDVRWIYLGAGGEVPTAAPGPASTSASRQRRATPAVVAGTAAPSAGASAPPAPRAVASPVAGSATVPRRALTAADTAALAAEVGVVGPASRGILALFTARGTRMDQRQPRTRFGPTDRQVAAIVRIGPHPGATKLAIGWSRLDLFGRPRPLFSQTTPVRAGVFAWSLATARRAFTPGDFEVTATLGRERVSTRFAVTFRDPARDGARPTRGGVRHSGFPTGPEGRLATGAQLAFLHSSQPAPSLLFAALDDQSQAGEGGGQSIEPGESGSAPPDDWDQPADVASTSQPPDSAPQPCGVGPVLAFANTDTTATVTAATNAWNCGGAEVVLYAAGGSAEQEVARAPGTIRTLVDPCELPGGSDLPGAVVRFRSTVIGHSDLASTAELTLPDEGEANLTARITGDPPPGSKVSAGQGIVLNGMACVLGFAYGVQHLQFTADPGGSLGSLDYPAPPPPCDNRRRLRAGKATYVVPKNPPSVVKITAIAEDYVGTQAVSTAAYPTRDNVWIGRIAAFLDQNVPDGEQTAEAAYQLVLEEDAEHRLTGTISGTQRQTLDLTVCPSTTALPGAMRGTLVGEHDGSTMRLRVADATWRAPEVTACPRGGMPGRIGDLIELPALARALAAIQADPDRHDASFERGEAIEGAGYRYTVSYVIEIEK